MSRKINNKNKHNSLDNLLADQHKDCSKGYSLSVLIAVFLVTISMAAICWYIYDSYQDKQNGEVLIISADDIEIKIEPEDPGGMIVDNMDKSVYDSIDGKSLEVNKAERVLLPAEEPIDKNDYLEVVNTKQVITSSDRQDNTAQELIIEDISEEKEINPALKEITKKSKEIKKNKKFYKVQIASFKMRSDVEKEWEYLSNKFPKIIGNYRHYIVVKDIEGRGIFYRLQIGPFDDAVHARKACKLIKESNLNCFLIKP